MKNLTKNQKQLVHSIIAEFTKTNEAKKAINVKSKYSFIDEFYFEANEEKNEKQKFYDDIKENNEVFKTKKSYAIEQVFNELLPMFKNYNIEVTYDKSTVKLHVTKDCGSPYGILTIFFNFFIREEKNYKFDISTTKYIGISSHVSPNRELNIDNICNCPNFLHEIKEMFFKHSDRIKNI
jgi:hypothetical protein